MTLPSRRVARAGGDARFVLGDDRQRLHESVAEIVGRLQAFSARDIAVRVAQLRVALGGQQIGALIVDDLVGGQHVVVVENFDIAAGDDLLALGVVNRADRPAD